ncbi:tetratricopeptide repeat protein [uncultured Paraglaciecola sp.]|uniref:tetratricopeptide repeat protein n=1 Tax=uncultured Paraglaciecola sp. TaxID=1765024 RepID=UPI0030D9B29A|tara:strand:- start:99791 stop:100519 length:729 start_codon:yes stop_codon:yes gene_type:complete
MKFTNVVVFSVLSLALLNSCSTLFTVNEIEANSKTAEVTTEVLTPLQTQAKALQAQPNLYQTQASEHIVDTQTLRQFDAALSLKKQGDFSQAQQQLLALSQQYPDFSGIWLQLALLAKELNKDDIAIQLKEMSKYLNNAVAVNPLNYQAHNELALVLRQQGQFQQAQSHYELALKSWPAFAAAYFNRGILYDLYMGEKSLALADFELYKVLSNDDSRQLTGWIMDLQRQIKSATQNAQSGGM